MRAAEDLPEALATMYCLQRNPVGSFWSEPPSFDKVFRAFSMVAQFFDSMLDECGTLLVRDSGHFTEPRHFLRNERLIIVSYHN